MKFVIQKTKKTFAMVLFLSYFFSVHAAGELLSSDARSFSLGNVQALSESLLNPAQLSFSKKQSLGVDVWNRFVMSDLNTVAMLWKCPNPVVDFGVKLTSFGYSDYRISQLQGHFAKKLFNVFSIGVNLNYIFQSSVLEENNRHFVSSGIGIYYRMNDKIDWAASGEHLLSTFDEKPWALHAGMRYMPSKDAVLLLETSYDHEKTLFFSAGLEYAILQQFFLRSGYSSLGKTPSFGLGYSWKKWKVDVGFSIHNVLGMSSIIGVNYEL